MFNFILAISENGKYITEESSPLSATINHALNYIWYGADDSKKLKILIPLAIFVFGSIFYKRWKNKNKK
jgi:hypothetical protein